MERIETTTPRGNPLALWHRPGTSDLSIIFATCSPWGGPCEDEYKLAGVRVDGLALDIGAHIGTITMTLLADNPGCRVIAVEPLPENVEMIRRNLAENGYEDRCEVVWGAFGGTRITHGYEGDSGAVANRYIGNLTMMSDEFEHSVATVPQVKLAKLIPHGADFAKIDCEGCEWAALREAAAKRITRIIGEGHGSAGAQNWSARITSLLGKTHDVRVVKEDGGIGLFEAVLR